MIAFTIRRFVAGVLTLFVICTLCFAISRLAPGSPFTTERGMREDVKKRYEEHYGLDKPFYVQYFRALAGFARGELGPSTSNFDIKDCSVVIAPAFQKSALLGLLASLIAILIGVPLGIIAAARQNRIPDYLAMSSSLFGICIPNFLLGPLLVLLFANGLGWLPSGLWPQNFSEWAELKKLILPAFTLAMVHVAYISRLSRAGMLDVIHKDYIRTARAKGLSEGSVVLKHALKNGITPAISYIGPMMALIITGSIVVESVFAIPGLGTPFVKSALNRDFNMIMGCVLVYSTMLITLNFLVDLTYGLLDPRVRMA